MAKDKVRDNSDSRIASLKLQDKEYNELYRQWRIDHKDDYGFYFLDNSDELTYRDGEGFITEYPEAGERSAVNEIHSVIGKTLIFYTLLNIISAVGGIFLPSMLGLNVTYDSAGFFTGDEVTALILTMSVNIIKRIIPMFYLMNKVKMPLKVMIPLKVSNKPLFNIAVPMAMFIFAITTIMLGIELFWAALIGIDGTASVWLPENSAVRAVYAFYTIIIIPLISEVIHRGIFMQILKQFGDGYALVVTSIICAAVTGNVCTMLFTFVYSLVIGYFSMRSGSVLTALVMRVVISTSSYCMTYMRLTDPTGAYGVTITMLFLLVYATVGITAVIFFIKRHSNRINLTFYGMYMSFKERMMWLIVNPWVIGWISLTVLHALFVLR